MEKGDTLTHPRYIKGVQRFKGVTRLHKGDTLAVGALQPTKPD